MLKRLGIPVLALFFVYPPGVAAQDSVPVVRAFADIAVDGVDAGEHTVLIAPADVLVSADDAHALHIPATAAALRVYDRLDFVSLAALGPAVTYHFDEAAIALDVHVAPQTLGSTTTPVIADTPPPELDVSRPRSTFGNYLVSESTSGSGGFLEAGESAGNHLVYSSLSAQSGSPLERGSTYYAFDDVVHRRRETVGDATLLGDSLVGDTDYFGLGMRRAFELDPFLYRFASPSVQGIVAAPATADIYVNGIVTRSVPLLPGGFDLTQLPVTSGQNDVAVVVRDAEGNVQRFDRSYFATPSLLRPGLSDYQYGLGFVRDSLPQTGYGPGGFYGAYRLGVNAATTLGGRFDATLRQSVGELAGDFKIPYGALHLGVAHSDEGGTGGNAFSADGTVQSNATGFSADVALHSRTFTDLTSVPAILEPAAFDGRLSFSRRFGRSISLTLQGERQTFAELPSQTMFDAIATTNIGRATTAIFTLQRTRVGNTSAQPYVNISFTRALGARGTLQTNTGAGTTSAGYQSSPPSSLTGFGYGLQVAQTDGVREVSANAVDHLRYADVQSDFDDIAGTVDGSVTLSGGFASIGGRTMASRPISDAFVLVDSGEPGVAITLDGRDAGTTDRSGFLIVSEVAANGVNRLAVDGRALSIDDEVRSPESFVSPGSRGGSIARLRVAKVAYVIGTVRFAGSDGPRVPRGGTLFLSGASEARSPLDDDGRYYFENLVPGRYSARVRIDGGSCTFALVVPRTSEVGTDLGTDTCGPAS